MDGLGIVCGVRIEDGRLGDFWGVLFFKRKIEEEEFVIEIEKELIEE